MGKMDRVLMAFVSLSACCHRQYVQASHHYCLKRLPVPLSLCSLGGPGSPPSNFFGGGAMVIISAERREILRKSCLAIGGSYY